jgi:hypothetical protein
MSPAVGWGRKTAPKVDYQTSPGLHPALSTFSLSERKKMNVSIPLPSTAFPLPPSAPKRRRTLYLFEQDLEDVDRYYSLLYLAAAKSGRKMTFSKTNHLRDSFHAFTNQIIRPQLAALQERSKEQTDQIKNLIG